MDLLGLEVVREQVATAARNAGRDQREITLVAVTKYASDEEVMAAYKAGHRDFGERRADELAARAARLPNDIRWHFIGRLQTNKVRLVRPVVSVLHSLDRESLAVAWMKQVQSAPPVFAQVDLANEPQKGGVDPAELSQLLDRATEIGVDVRGLMAIPPAGVIEESRRWFGVLRGLRDEIVTAHPRAAGLSMGMTNDFAAAVEEGATVLRVGRAIFQPEEKG